MLSDDFLPIFDVSDELAVLVDADSAATWAALMDAARSVLSRTSVSQDPFAHGGTPSAVRGFPGRRFGLARM